MSQANVNLVLRALRAVAERPEPDFETINALYHPEHVLVPVAASMLGEAEAKGARGFKAWLEMQEGTMPFELTVDGAVDVAANVVLATTTIHFRGASSGVVAERRAWNVVTLAEGKIIRTESFLDGRGPRSRGGAGDRFVAAGLAARRSARQLAAAAPARGRALVRGPARRAERLLCQPPEDAR